MLERPHRARYGGPDSTAPTASNPPDLAGGGVRIASMAPGTDTAAASVVITPQGGGAEVEVQAADGGFDPVPVPASGGDTLLITIKRHSGESVPGYAQVPLASRPIIVRTSPPKGKTDVPLNAVIVLIFSEPMDSASLSTGVRLRWSGGEVLATVRPAPVFGNPGLAAEVIPTDDLLPATVYTITVDSTATSALGAHLAEPVSATFTTSTVTEPPPPPPPTETAPTVSIVESMLGDSVPIGWIRLLIDVESSAALTSLRYDMVYPGTSRERDPMISTFSTDLRSRIEGTRRHNRNPVNPPITPGEEHVAVTVTDDAGREGADTVTLVFVDPDTVSWLMVNSFTVLEIQYPGEPDYWYYAPQLEVTDTSVLGGSRVVGFRMSTIPGLPSPFPDSWYRGAQPADGAARQLFREIYGDFPLSFFAGDGHRSTGGTAEARLLVLDGGGHYHMQAITATVMPGEFPNTYTGGCGWWEAQGVYEVFSWCPVTVRQRSP